MRLHLEALYALSPDVRREEWLKLLFGFKDAGGTLDEFADWSAQAPNYNRQDVETSWRNAKAIPGGVTEATLFMAARLKGWKPAPGNGGDGAPRVAAPRPAPAAEVAPPVVTDPAPIWDACVAVVAHAYLAKKGIAAHGARVTTAGTLAVPYVNQAGQLQTLQFIAADGSKRFLKGARQKGAVAVVGEPRGAALLCVAEGFATAAAIHQATGLACIASGSRGTMPEAARIARAWTPEGVVVLCADVGDMTTPIAAARGVEGRVAAPGDNTSAEGFDFCDWRLSGATDAQIRARIDQATPASAPPDSPLPSVAVPFVCEDVRVSPADVALASANDVAPRPSYVTDARGNIVPNLANVATWLESGALGDFALDTFTGARLWNGAPLGDDQLGEVTRLVQSRAYIDGAFAFPRVPVFTVADAINQATRAHAFNSNVRWLDTLAPWDGVERLTSFFQDIAGAAPTDYTAGAGRYFWVSLVNRMVNPGCKADAAVVIIGAQGVGKSSLGRIIGGERYGEASLALIGTRDWFAELRGKIIVELSELSGHSRAETETIKAVLSRQVDEYRPAYARTAQAIPRGCIFYGTTNERDFLIDVTGNRRWLPVESNGPLALDVAEGMRAQCFAEAYAIVRADSAGQYWVVPGSLAQQADHVALDPWLDILDDKLRGITGVLPDRIESVRVYELLKLPAERQTGGGTGRRIAAVMKSLGYDRARWYPAQGRQVRGFERPNQDSQGSQGQFQDASNAEVSPLSKAT